jgi:hypothetical protein
MNFSYLQHIGPLTLEQQLCFYALPAHHLPISIHGLWPVPHLSDTAELDRIYWLNGILHRRTAKVFTLPLSLHEWPEPDS